MLLRSGRTAISSRAYARAALAGNPSDGYGGRTIAFTFSQLHADVRVEPAERLIINADRGEGALLRAAFARFAAHCDDVSSAPAPCSLSVSQVYNGLVYMDFEPRLLRQGGHGAYEHLDPELLVEPYVAWCERAPVHSAKFHAELRRRFQAGDPDTTAALQLIARLADDARAALITGDTDGLWASVDANLDLRRKLGPLEPEHVRMVDVARSVGACANYAGSGGAITGFVADTAMRDELAGALGRIGCTAIRPTPVAP